MTLNVTLRMVSPKQLMATVAVSIGLALSGSLQEAHADNYTYSGGYAVHWSDRGNAYTVVNFIDHTGGSTWPVSNVVSNWQSNGSQFFAYTSGPNASSCSFHCVSVRATDNLGHCIRQNYPTFGRTEGYVWPNGHLNSDTNVQLNKNCAGLDNGARRQIVCHEMGHAGGYLAHRSGACLQNDEVYAPYDDYPGDHNLSMFGPLGAHQD